MIDDGYSIETVNPRDRAREEIAAARQALVDPMEFYRSHLALGAVADALYDALLLAVERACVCDPHPLDQEGPSIPTSNEQEKREGV